MSTVNQVRYLWYNMTMKKPDMPLMIHNASKFSWTGDQGVTEASDIRAFDMRWATQVWSDRCDVGFMLHSDRTGVDKLFILTGSRVQPRGVGLAEVLCWHFASEDGFTVTVFND
jgi:hypothetical protein